MHVFSTKWISLCVFKNCVSKNLYHRCHKHVVSLHVYLKASGLSKLFTTDGKGMWFLSHVLLLFLSIMHKHMSSQVVCPCKLLTTDVKGIWFLSSMNKHVLLEVSRLYEMLSKDITKVLFLSSISTHVLH